MTRTSRSVASTCPWLLLCLAARLAGGQAPAISPRALGYLTGALDTMQAVIIHRDTVTWKNVRDSALLIARGAQDERDTYGAIAWALRRANGHSFFQARQTGVVSRLLEGRVGYVRVPQIGGAGVATADSIHSAVRMLDSTGACGWIVDLRGNGGGNMWPMLAGIGPLLGDTIVGSFGESAAADRWFYRDGISANLKANGSRDTAARITVPPYRLKDPNAPVAILFDGITASSGEALAVAFRGRPNTRSFGSISAGAATANRGSRLPDGANMVVTADFMTDRRGVGSGGQLTPDTTISMPAWIFPGWPFPTDQTASVARAWVIRQSACRR
jgi:carboxyl-terminal processing protease